MSENLLPVTAETSKDEDDADSTKSKSKKKALGAFLVEAEPAKKKETANSLSAEKPEATLLGKSRSTETLPADALTGAEKVIAVQQLAAARRGELDTESNQVGSPATEAEMAAAAAFLAAAEALGDTEAAYDQVTAEMTSPEMEVTDSEIDTNQPNEGEIDLHGTAGAETVDNADETSLPVTNSSGSGGSSVPPSPPRVNATPTAPAAAPGETSIPSNEAYSNERRALTDGLIVGGVVGYLYGRRRGRIKTEKRLAPVQRKLEKQVKSLQSELLQAETAVRQQARNFQQQRPREAALAVERFQKTFRLESARRPEWQSKPAVVQPERIGHVLVAASAAAGGERLKSEFKPTKQETQTAKKRAETMNRNELLELSELIEVDGTNLRKIYETQLVSEKGLRRLVTEHLRGGNVARALRRELVQHEIDFERDPIFRDRGTADSASVSGAGKTALSGLLEKAGVSERQKAELIGSDFKKLDAKKAESTAIAKMRQQKLIDTALITLITVLVIAIVIILMRGR